MNEDKPEETPEYLAGVREEARNADRKDLLCDYDRWNNLCDALCETKSELPLPVLGTLLSAHRIKHKLMHLIQSEKDAAAAKKTG